METRRSAFRAFARATRAVSPRLAGPPVISKMALAKPCSTSFSSISFARRRLNSYSGTPRALNAPGASAVCPTSTTIRNVAWSHCGGCNSCAETLAAAPVCPVDKPCRSTDSRAKSDSARSAPNRARKSTDPTLQSLGMLPPRSVSSEPVHSDQGLGFFVTKISCLWACGDDWRFAPPFACVAGCSAGLAVEPLCRGVRRPSNGNERLSVIEYVDIDHADAFAGAPHFGCDNEAGVDRRSQIVHAEVDGRQTAAQRHHQGIVADGVDNGGQRPAMPLPGAGAALEFRPHGARHGHLLARRIGLDDLEAQEGDEGRAVQVCLQLRDRQWHKGFATRSAHGA